jgi:hypothetical protein
VQRKSCTGCFVDEENFSLLVRSCCDITAFSWSQFVGLKKNHFLCSQIQEKMGNIKIIRGVFDTELELEHASVAAGFPSPADDYRHETLDFNRQFKQMLKGMSVTNASEALDLPDPTPEP